MHLPIKTRFVAVATTLLCLAFSTPDAWAKGKGGGGKGGRGGGKAQADFSGPKRGGGGGNRPTRDTFSGRRPTTRHDHRGTADRPFRSQDIRDRFTRGADRWTADSGGAGSHPWSMQRANEERKLNHRLGVADKLDQLAERSGNTNLHDTATRQREKAWEHYDKRLAKINSKDPSYVPPEEGLTDGGEDLLGDSDLLNDTLTELPAPSTGEPTPAAPPGGTLDSLDETVEAVERLTGRENALYRQLRNEQRKLASRMEAAQRLWDAYEQTGDEALADAARAFEERALSHFDKRIQAISDFQQRHGLTDQVGQVLEELEEIGLGSREVSVLQNAIP